MLFVVKLFPEITIKSRPVRRRMIRILRRNLRALLREIDPGVAVTGEWDSLDVTTSVDSEEVQARVTQRLQCTPGIDQFLVVASHPLGDYASIASHCLNYYAPLLRGRTFAVRCKRQGEHPFTSTDVERHVGALVLQQSESLGVRLEQPEVTVRVEIRHDQLLVVKQRCHGLGGFPIGSQDAVLSLISGGFDSAVSSFLCIRRGLITHFCFFNLGGRAHEVAVKEVALYLWMKFGASQRVKFVSVPFEDVVAEILARVDDSQMGVVLKRMMLRAAGMVAERMHVQALVTGESIAQVSSQTLANLAVIDSITDKLLLRPLITSDKQEIIALARQIGTEEFSRNVPEYCGVISVKPTTRARMERVVREESNFNLELIDQAVAAARIQLIDQVADDIGAEVPEIRMARTLVPGETVIDIRHPDERERRPLGLATGPVLEIPFYQLQSWFAENRPQGPLLLYCERGMLSRLHAAHLRDQGYPGVGVYVPRGRQAESAAASGRLAAAAPRSDK